MKLLSIFGTRPEAVKLAPILLALDGEPQVTSQVCVTAQHRELLDQVLAFFCIDPDFDLDAMRPAQGLNGLLARVIERIDPILAGVRPDRVVVQGDTTTALAAALAAFHRGIPVAHVEAGLRTYCPAAPFPEEANRRAIALIADLHFAPTPAARANLAGERLRGGVHVTGNSGIDALRLVLGQIGATPPADPAKKLILVTCHRRESFGTPFAAIGAALERLARRRDTDILFPRHPNPGLGAAPRQAHALPPLGLPDFVRLMRRADVILTDSGGVQEEAAALGKPVVILRETTERPEAIEAGAAVLAGSDPDRIVGAAEAWLEGIVPPPAPSDAYGDGFAARRIVDALLGRPVDEFIPNRLAPAAWSTLTS
ncbi:MAG TPA: UDP-N-acetylglucosamine 2-epimerase (non-hydrolyzing) [Allosphingosinicella sp.]|nr:UDP-N-acetylglucosamine 2-epimerase (non-hydrolyzing) [Allosphingosinicella sp.]